MKTLTKKRSMFLLICSTAVLFALDQATKYAARRELKEHAPVPLIPGVFELQYLENRGSAFGFLQGQRVLFIVMAVLILFLIPYIYYRIPLTGRFLYLRIIASMYLAGAAGNAADRIVYGYVTDFFYFSLIDFPVFNVADIYVTVSTFFLIVLLLFYYKEEDFAQIHIFSK